MSDPAIAEELSDVTQVMRDASHNAGVYLNALKWMAQQAYGDGWQSAVEQAITKAREEK